MRKWTACLAIFGVATIGFGLVRTVTRQESRVQAQQPARETAAAPTHHPVPAAGGSGPSHRTRARSRVALIEDSAFNQPDGSVAFRDSEPVRSAPRIADFTEHSQEEIRRTPNMPPRVTLALAKDHQVQIVPSGMPIHAGARIPTEGMIFITAEKFHLTPATEVGTGHQIHCNGTIEIHSEQFTASGTHLSIQKGELVLEGTPEQPAVVTKTAPRVTTPATLESVIDRSPPTPTVPNSFPRTPIVPAPEFVHPRAPGQPTQAPTIPLPAPEFRVSATRITFTLTLDRLQVGNATVVTPAGPVAPTKPAEVKPIETNGTSDAGPLPPPMPQDAPDKDALNIGEVLSLPG